MEKEKEKHCSGCGDPASEFVDKMIVEEGDPYCRGCWDAEFAQCEVCGDQKRDCECSFCEDHGRYDKVCRPCALEDYGDYLYDQWKDDQLC